MTAQAHKNAKARRKKKKEQGSDKDDKKVRRETGGGASAPVNRSIPEQVSRFLKGVLAESKRVSWPSKPELIAGTITTLVILLVFACFLGGSDYILRFITAKLGL